MGISRIIIIPVVLALTATGSVLAGAAVSASAAQASVAQVHSVATSTTPGTHYHA
jgi:hypothetical protein